MLWKLTFAGGGGHRTNALGMKTMDAMRSRRGERCRYLRRDETSTDIARLLF